MSGPSGHRCRCHGCRSCVAEHVGALVQPHLDAGLKRALNGSPARALLSPRELEILAYVRGGTSTKDIAAALWVSPSTVRKHLENVYAKLDVHGRTEAVAKVYGHPGAASPRH